MVLPCPHCKKHFKLNVGQLPEKTTKLKCPACDGIFVFKPSASNNEAMASTGQKPPSPLATSENLQESQNNVSQETNKHNDSTTAIHPKTKKELSKSRKTIPASWFMVPVVLLLLFLVGAVGIFMPTSKTVFEKNKKPSSQEKKAANHSLSASLKNKAPKSNQIQSKNKKSIQTASKIRVKDSLYQLLWSFTSIERQESCKRLNQLQTKWLQEKKRDPCRIYSPWIAYLSLETASIPACKLEPAFAIATEAIQKKAICGPGYAFLSAYYIHKRIMDRSESFLNEALYLSPKDPWVKTVEAVFYQRIYQDNEKALIILQNIFQHHPDFPLVWYLMARLYIEAEEYEKASAMFQLLKKNFPQQGAFHQIQQALLSINEASYYSRKKAEGLLEISKAFMSLKNYHIAEHLSQKVLKEMKSMLSKEKQKLAFYELGRIYEMKQDKDNAYASYLSALQIDPNFKAARDRIGHLLQKKAKSS